MLEASKEKAALWAAGPLVVGFSCEVEAQPGDFAVALDEELAHTPGDEVFVNLYLNGRGKRGLTPGEGASWG